MTEDKELGRGGLWQLAASISRLHIVAIAALGTFTFAWIFYGQRFWLIALLCAFDWFIVNLLNRVVDLKEDKKNKILGTGFVEDHRRFITVIGLGSLALSFALTIYYWPGLTVWRGAYHLLGILYNWRLLPSKRRLKELYFFKNTASASGFLITVFIYPIAANPDLSWAPEISVISVWAAASFFFFFELSYEVIYDLRDIDGDRLAGVQSYPVVHGERASLVIIDCLLALSILIMVSSYLLHWVPWRLFVMIAAPVGQRFIYRAWYRRGLTARDCILLTWLGVALLITYHLWVYFELPGVGL
jgi:4-hydroxybenzoate polyprenyltransferase